MYRYGNPEQTTIVSESGMTIPVDGGNRHYQEVLAWVEAGNTIEPYEAPPPAPVTVVTPRQARLALLQGGKLEMVEAAITASDKATQVTWEYAVEFKRDDPLLIALATQLGLTAKEVDDFFSLASTL